LVVLHGDAGDRGIADGDALCGLRQSDWKSLIKSNADITGGCGRCQNKQSGGSSYKRSQNAHWRFLLYHSLYWLRANGFGIAKSAHHAHRMTISQAAEIELRR
jgi:hypothetical protein